MTTRAEILAETLARLEAERYQPRPSWSLPEPVRRHKAPTAAHKVAVQSISDEEALGNRRQLEEAIADNVVAMRKSA